MHPTLTINGTFKVTLKSYGALLNKSQQSKCDGSEFERTNAVRTDHPWFPLNPARRAATKKKKTTKLRGEGAGGAAGGRSTARRGRKWVSVFILLSLIPQGCTNRQELSPNPPTDVRAHCLFQSWQKGSKGHLSRSPTSSPHPFIPLPFRGALHLPHKPL